MFHLTIRLSMSDHLYMPFIYKVTHIVIEQSSGHYVRVLMTDRPHSQRTRFFLSSYRIGDSLLQQRPADGQTDK